MIIDLVKYLSIVMILFILGIWGIFLNRKNIIIMLMSIELMLLAVNLNFIIFSVYLDDLLGQIFAIFILTVAAAESAVGLSILVIYSRIKGSLAIDFIHLMKG
jgi:NADH-quinone oxidoreductase subunit K